MDWLLVGFFILLFEGKTTSETLKSQLSNVPPVLQRLLLSDVSNVQLSNGRRSYFGAVPEMARAPGSKAQNAAVDKRQTDTRWITDGSLLERQHSANASQSPVADIRKQFEDSFQQSQRDGTQFSDVNPNINPGFTDVNLGNSESSPAEKVLSDKDSQTPLRLAALNTTGSASTNKTNITDGLLESSTSAGVESSNLTDNSNTSQETNNHLVTDPVQQMTEQVEASNTTDPAPQMTTVGLNITTDSVTQTTDSFSTDITGPVTQTTTGNRTSSATISPTTDPCPDYPGLVAGLVVTAMVLAVLVIMLLSLYCKRIVLTCGSMCRCTKYTLV